MSQSLFTRLAERFEDPGCRISRRQALASLALTGAAIALPGCSWPTRDRDHRGVQGRMGRVAVVGGGFSGLTSADALTSANYEVVVLEARKRVGGRVLTLRNLGSKYAEGGGEWIGLNHPAWRRLADRFCLELVEASEEPGVSPIVLNGRRLTASEAEALYDEMTVQLADLTERARQITDPRRPWIASSAVTLDRTSVEEWLSGRTMSDACRAGVRAQLEHDNGVALSRMSLLGLLAQVAGGGGESYWTDSEVFRCRGGNQRLAEALADSVGRESIQFGAAVNRIELGEGGAKIHTSSGEFDADAVILATPPSTWHTITVIDRSGQALPLPGVQMGMAFKYLAAVSKPWWRDAGRSPDGFSDQLIGYTWNPFDGQPAGGGDWICGFGGGAGAENLPQQPEQRRTALRQAVESILPGFDEARLRDDPSERLMVWPDDPWTRAGYSCPGPGQVTSLGPKLAAGINAEGQAPLVFAGEHCYPPFAGYMEGAIQSGAAAALQVAQRVAARSSAAL